MDDLAKDGGSSKSVRSFDQQAASLRRRTAARLIAETQSVERPIAVFTGGQPGAGKSSAITVPFKAKFANQGGIAVVDPDQLRPLFAQAREEIRRTGEYSDAGYQASGRLAFEVGQDLAGQSRNLLRDGTLASPKYPVAEMEALHQRGYRVEVHVAAVYDGLSHARCANRREEERASSDIGFGRDVPKSFHDEAVAGVANTVAALWTNPSVARLALYAADGTVIFDRARDAKGQWITKDGREHTGPGPREVLEHHQRTPSEADLLLTAKTWLSAKAAMLESDRKFVASEPRITALERGMAAALERIDQSPTASALASRDEPVLQALRLQRERPLHAVAEAWLRNPAEAKKHWPEHRDLLAYADKATSQVTDLMVRRGVAHEHQSIRAGVAEKLAKQQLVEPRRLQEFVKSEPVPARASPARTAATPAIERSR